MESESDEFNESEGNYDKKIDSDKQAELNKLIEEYQIATSKKNVYINREEIFREIFMTVSNRLEIDPFITEKLHFKKKKGEKGCCNIY
jgi:hypothetical protein